MEGVIAFGPQQYSHVRDLKVPVISSEYDILVKVECVGICASDGKMYKGADLFWNPKTGRAKPPVIPGHEFVGRVVEIGDKATERFGLAVGDLAVAEQLLVCGSCWHCLNGGSNKCDNLKIYGQALDGAMAEYMIYKDGSFIHKVPYGLSAEEAVLAEPLAVSVHAVDQANLKPIENDLIFCVAGCGTIGLGVIAVLRDRYPMNEILAIDYFDFKLKMARESGATTTFNVSQLDFHISKIQELCGGKGGVDVYFEASGHQESISQGINLLRKRGKLIHVGICASDCISCDWNKVSAGKELTIVGSSLGVGCWPNAFSLLSKKLLTNIITHQYTLEEFADAFELGMNPQHAVKVIIDPRCKESISLIRGFSLLRNIRLSAMNGNKGKTLLMVNCDHIPQNIMAETLKTLSSNSETSPSFMNIITHWIKWDPIRDHGKIPVYGDFTNADHVKRMINAIFTEFGRIHFVFICYPDTVTEDSYPKVSYSNQEIAKSLSHSINQRVVSVVSCITEILPKMVAGGAIHVKKFSTSSQDIIDRIAVKTLQNYLDLMQETFKGKRNIDLKFTVDEKFIVSPIEFSTEPKPISTAKSDQ